MLARVGGCWQLIPRILGVRQEYTLVGESFTPRGNSFYFWEVGGNWRT